MYGCNQFVVWIEQQTGYNNKLQWQIHLAEAQQI